MVLEKLQVDKLYFTQKIEVASWNRHLAGIEMNVLSAKKDNGWCNLWGGENRNQNKMDQIA